MPAVLVTGPTVRQNSLFWSRNDWVKLTTSCPTRHMIHVNLETSLFRQMTALLLTMENRETKQHMYTKHTKTNTKKTCH